MNIEEKESDNKFNQYRDLLENWVNWWNHFGRQNYVGTVLPPLKRTEKSLTCIACHNEINNDEEYRCAVCNKKIEPLPPGACN